MDRYEVTVARFRRFIDTYDTWRDNKPFAGDGALHGVPGTGWSLALSQSLPQNKSGILASFTATPGVTSCGNQVAWTDAPGVNEGKPITCVTWYVAYAFCIWDGGRLPTEAEWNFAAAGGEVQRAFPWSDPASDRSAPKNLANLDNSLGLRDVGTSAGAGYYGHADLSGNAFEWTRDGCDDCQAPNASAPGPELLTYAVESCTDCLTKEGTSRIIRGGSFKFPTNTGRTAYRGSNPSANPFDDIGFRCARDPND